MSPPGATSAPIDGAGHDRTTQSADSFFLPDFCDPRMVLAVVLVSELLAVVFSLARPGNLDFLTELARISMLMQWLALTSSAVLCALKRPLRRASTVVITTVVLGLVLANILLLSIALVIGGQWLGGGNALEIFPEQVWPFALRNMVIGLIVTALLLRYFFVSHQWRLHVEAEARSRIDALQARIRPHFLFNSMNTIASLTRSDPGRAEEAVEDLADLFRVTLNDVGRQLSLKEELELTRIYQRIEKLRLGQRLEVAWDVAELPMSARIPALTIQPLLENAIYHGIERLDAGGTVTIRGRRFGDEIEISVVNPTARSDPDDVHVGHKIAVENIRERLRLAFPGYGSLVVERSDGAYAVTVRFPVT